MYCAFCNNKIDVKGVVGRDDGCPYCNMNLRCCKQCKFYDKHAYNDCREVIAERIADKERANFCEYFILRGTKNTNTNRTMNAKKALNALFKK